MVSSVGRTTTSIKESVRIAQSNNFMGLICSSRLLGLVPTLVTSIKEAGLVLISDFSHDTSSSSSSAGANVQQQRSHRAAPSLQDLQRGLDGLLVGNAVLRFKEVVEQ